MPRYRRTGYPSFTERPGRKNATTLFGPGFAHGGFHPPSRILLFEPLLSRLFRSLSPCRARLPRGCFFGNTVTGQTRNPKIRGVYTFRITIGPKTMTSLYRSSWAIALHAFTCRGVTAGAPVGFFFFAWPGTSLTESRGLSFQDFACGAPNEGCWARFLETRRAFGPLRFAKNATKTLFEPTCLCCKRHGRAHTMFREAIPNGGTLWTQIYGRMNCFSKIEPGGPGGSRFQEGDLFYDLPATNVQKKTILGLASLDCVKESSRACW